MSSANILVPISDLIGPDLGPNRILERTVWKHFFEKSADDKIHTKLHSKELRICVNLELGLERFKQASALN